MSTVSKKVQSTWTNVSTVELCIHIGQQNTVFHVKYEDEMQVISSVRVT
jgi:hypothetical protein